MNERFIFCGDIVVNREKQLDRMARILEGAETLFLRAGYRRTQMADIAKETRIASGTLYNYFSSKEALFDFLLRRHMLQLPRSEWPEIPVPTPAPGSILSLLKVEGRRVSSLPTLMAAINREECKNPRSELGQIVREYYRTHTTFQVLISLVESSALDWPELAKLYRKEVITTLEQDFIAYLRKRIRQGHFKPLPDLLASVRLIWETVHWFARIRPNDPRAKKISNKAAEETVVEALTRVFVPA